MRRGEVRWHEPPEVKRWPVLILGRDEAIGRLHDVLVVPATTRVRGIATEVGLDRADGMPVPCVLSLDNTFLAEQAMIGRPIATLAPARMAEVCRALGVASGCG